MNEKEFKQITEEYLEKVRQSGKKETSDLVSDIKNFHLQLSNDMQNIIKRLDTANGYTAKHEQRLNTQDVFNAQTTMTQTQTIDSLKTILTRLEDISKFKNEAEGSLATYKWLFGFLGIGGIIALIKLFF